VSWQVRNPISSDPPSVDFPNLSPGESGSRNVAVVLDGMGLCPRCRIEAKPMPQSLTAELELAGPERAGHEQPPKNGPAVIGKLAITVPPSTEESSLHGVVDLDIMCGDEHRAQFSLPVAWTVVPVIRFTPARLSFGTARVGDKIHRKVIVRAMRGGRFAILERATATRDGFTIRGGGGRDVTHVIEIDGEVPRRIGPWRSIIQIDTDHPDARQVEIPISGLIVDGV
jgi:hypothetical protein